MTRPEILEFFIKVQGFYPEFAEMEFRAMCDCFGKRQGFTRQEVLSYAGY